MEDEAEQPGRDGDVPCGVLVLPSGLGCDLLLSVVENVFLQMVFMSPSFVFRRTDVVPAVFVPLNE